MGTVAGPCPARMPESLVLERLPPPRTEQRAPGPGAVRKVEWLPLANKYLIILHTDAARSFTTRVDGVLHDNVVHAKQRKVIKGKARWVKPTYVKVMKHKLPGTNKVVKVKGGTQIIDRAWRYIKDRLTLNQNTRAGSAPTCADSSCSVPVLVQERRPVSDGLQARAVQDGEDVEEQLRPVQTRLGAT